MLPQEIRSLLKQVFKRQETSVNLEKVLFDCQVSVASEQPVFFAQLTHNPQRVLAAFAPAIAQSGTFKLNNAYALVETGSNTPLLAFLSLISGSAKPLAIVPLTETRSILTPPNLIFSPQPISVRNFQNEVTVSLS